MEKIDFEKFKISNTLEFNRTFANKWNPFSSQPQALRVKFPFVCRLSSFYKNTQEHLLNEKIQLFKAGEIRKCQFWIRSRLQMVLSPSSEGARKILTIQTDRKICVLSSYEVFRILWALQPCEILWIKKYQILEDSMPT